MSGFSCGPNNTTEPALHCKPRTETPCRTSPAPLPLADWRGSGGCPLTLVGPCRVRRQERGLSIGRGTYVASKPSALGEDTRMRARWVGILITLLAVLVAAGVWAQ